MPTRFEYLVKVRSIDAAPRQPVPEDILPRDAAGESAYLAWLQREAAAVRVPFDAAMSAAVRKFNHATWPGELGLANTFPFRIWRDVSKTKASLQAADIVSIGEILQHDRTVNSGAVQQDASPQAPLEHSFAIGTTKVAGTIEVQQSGVMRPVRVPLSDVHRCRGAGVFVPGPPKRKRRCEEKIANDYAGQGDWPPAASITDLVRAMVVMDDPYAMAVFVTFLQTELKVLRVKNRFAHDDVEKVSVERLQAEFYTAETFSAETDDTVSSSSGTTGSGNQEYDKMYRDVMLNVEMKTASGLPFVCEIQVTLSGITILKKSEQLVYTLMRMESPRELHDTSVFSAKDADAKPSPLAAAVSSPEEAGKRLSTSTCATSLGDLEEGGRSYSELTVEDVGD
jgi:hypothetical protein